MRISRLERLVRRSGLFGWQLRGPVRARLKGGLQDPWFGDAARGAQVIAAQSADESAAIPTGEEFAAFEWLRDLRSAGDRQARTRARELITKWIAANQKWQLPDWQPDLMGRRLAAIAMNYGWYGNSASESFQEILAQSVEMQIRCLAMDWHRVRPLDAQIAALGGLALAEVEMPVEAGRIGALCQVVISKLDKLLLADGGHASRMPDRHIALMRRLVELRMAVNLAGAETAAITARLNRMGAIARMWRHGDGRLAHFNGGGMIAADRVEETIQRAGISNRPLQQAPYTGFLRVGSGRTVIVMDAGAPAFPVDDIIVGSGTLGFEMSVGQSQIVVNPGQMSPDSALRGAMCTTAAHSTVGLDNQNSTSHRTGRLANVSNVEVGEARGGVLAVATHDGFDASHGILHERKLYLKTGGANLRGSDTLTYTGAPGDVPDIAIVRFHLHPKVAAAMLSSGAALLKIRGSKAGWTLKASGASLEIDNSTYFEDGVRQASQQLVLKSPISNIRTKRSHEIKWAFARSGG